MTPQSEFSAILNNSQKIGDNAHLYRRAEIAYADRDDTELGAAVRAIVEYEKQFSEDLHR